jgi:hypothetical protein
VEQTHNGGLPEPLPGEPVRQVRFRHEACGADTRVRIPFALSAEAVRRVVCEGCGQAYECDAVVDETAAEAPPSVPPVLHPRPSRVPRWLSDPDSRVWRYLSIPVAAAAVIGVLALIQGC